MAVKRLLSFCAAGSQTRRRPAGPRDPDYCKSQQPSDVVVELGRQRAGVQLVEVHELDEIHELGRASVQRVVDQSIHFHLSTSHASYRPLHTTFFLPSVTELTELRFFLWPPYVIRQAIYIFILSLVLLSSFFFPRLISAVADWMSTILAHMVWP